MTITSIKTADETEIQSSEPLLSRMGLIWTSILMLSIGVFLRIIDIFVLNLDVLWTNIILSKVLSLLTLVGFFIKFKPKEISSVLGLNKKDFRLQLMIGITVGISLYLATMVLSTVIYHYLIDPSLPLQFIVLLSPEMLVYFFFFAAVNAVYEETLFRGLVQNAFREWRGQVVGILISAIAFGVWHIIWPIQTWLEDGVFPVRTALVMVVFSGIMGMVFGVYYEKFSYRRTLTGTIVAHTLINYLNEGFKTVLGTFGEGPDLSFINPVHMAIGLIIALSAFTIMIISFSKFNIDQAHNRLNKAFKKAGELMSTVRK